MRARRMRARRRRAPREDVAFAEWGVKRTAEPCRPVPLMAPVAKRRRRVKEREERRVLALDTTYTSTTRARQQPTQTVDHDTLGGALQTLLRNARTGPAIDPEKFDVVKM